MFHFDVRPFGLAIGDGGIPYDEYRVSFRRDGDHPAYHRGSFRLTVEDGRWAVPHRDIVNRLCAYFERGGAKHFARNADIVYREGRERTFYSSLTVLNYGVRIGPLEDDRGEIPLVFIDDEEGGCTGYCELQDLPSVKDALHTIWLIDPGPDFLVQLYLTHAAKALRKDR